MRDSKDIWQNILLKSVAEEDIKFDIIEKREPQKKNQYQLFEVLICETLSKIYPDFHWYITPISKDKGIDFWAIKNDRSLPFTIKNKPIVIYGQAKRAKSYFSKQKIIEATNKIVQTHYDFYLQERNVYKIMHLISSDKKISYDFPITTGMVNTFQYIVEVINAEDIFTIWILNKRYFLSLIPPCINKEDVQILYNFLTQKNKKWADIIEGYVEPPNVLYLGETLEYKFTIVNHLDLPIFLELHIHLSDTNVFLIAPQNILKNSLHGLRVTLYNKYSFSIFIKIVKNITKSPAYLSVYSMDGNEITNINFPLNKISTNFNTFLNMKPIYKAFGILCEALSNENINLKFFSVVGEGGIGKSTLIHESCIWALNHNYAIYSIEHPCQETSEYNVILELIERFIEDDIYNIHLYENLNDLLKIKLSNHYNMAWNYTMEIFFKEKRIINSEQFFECFITLLIHVTDLHPVLLNISNLHWCNAKLIDFFNKLIRNLQLNEPYFNHNLVIIFEGRIYEAVKNEYYIKVAYEWFDFYRKSPIVPLKLQKWPDALSLEYIESLFKKDDLDPFTQKATLQLINLIYNHCKGNPMHITEAIITLKTEKYIERIAYNLYMPLKIRNAKIYIPNLIDTIKLRIGYYIEQWPLLMDLLIILSCLKKTVFLYKFIENTYEKNKDWKSILIDSGFVCFNHEQIIFLHENYKNAFSSLKLSCDKNADDVLRWYATHKYEISLVEEIKIQLRKKNIDYMTLYYQMIQAVNNTDNQRNRYELLQLILNIYEYLPEDNVVKRYHLYKWLETAAKEMGSWKTALEYNQKLKAMQLDVTDYMITCSHGRRNLANIYSFSMKWEKGITEALDAISKLEHFIKRRNFNSDENFQLERQRALLYNRLSIAYHFSGNHDEALKQDKIAMKIAKKNQDLYAIYHIQYERGVWKLNATPLNGENLIKNAKDKLLEMDFVSQQERDLVLTYYEMAFLKRMTERKTLSKSLLEKQLKRCINLSKTESMTNEALEPIICYLLCGILNIFLKDYLEAVNYFEKSLTIASRADMEQCLWMCYLNVSQAYAILAQDTDIWRDAYISKSEYYSIEAGKLISEALASNTHLENLSKVYSYPQRLISALQNRQIAECKFSCQDIKYSPIFVKYNAFAFFLL